MKALANGAGSRLRYLQDKININKAINKTERRDVAPYARHKSGVAAFLAKKATDIETEEAAAFHQSSRADGPSRRTYINYVGDVSTWCLVAHPRRNIDFHYCLNFGWQVSRSHWKCCECFVSCSCEGQYFRAAAFIRSKCAAARNLGLSKFASVLPAATMKQPLVKQEKPSDVHKTFSVVRSLFGS